MLNCAKAAWELPDGSFREDKKFLHVSTDEVYGSLEEDGGYFYETTPYAPHSPYSASKASSDMLVKSYMDTYQFPANITNCSNNYGPYQFPEKLIPLIINNALHGKKLPVYGDGKNVRDWLYVEDHAKAIDMVQERAGCLRPTMSADTMRSRISRLSTLSLRPFRSSLLMMIRARSWFQKI